MNLDVLCRQNKIWTFGNPFQSKIVANLHLESSDLQSLYMLPIWGFTDHFAYNNSYEPSQHLTVTNEGSFFAVYFLFLLVGLHNSEFLENLIKYLRVIVPDHILMWSSAQWVNTLLCVYFSVFHGNESLFARVFCFYRDWLTIQNIICAKKVIVTYIMLINTENVQRRGKKYTWFWRRFS